MLKKLLFISLLAGFCCCSLVACRASIGKKEPVSAAKSSSTSDCKSPPASFDLNNKTYQLAEKDTTLEPGTKLAFMTCKDGELTPGDADDSIIVYSNGNAGPDEVIVIGDWGRMLYSVNKK